MSGGSKVIAQLGATWSARTFRDRISVKLYESGYLKPGTKIGRATATYFLRTIGMVLVHPKKGIYKDGHERPDTIFYRKNYTAVLKAFQLRERSYEGKDLHKEVPPPSNQQEAIRIYHDECIYAFHEFAEDATGSFSVCHKSQCTGSAKHLKELTGSLRCTPWKPKQFRSN